MRSGSGAGETMARILWLSVETPDRKGQGGQRRQFHQIRELARLGHDITVLSPLSEQDDSSLRGIARVARPRLYLGPLAIPGRFDALRRRALSDEWDRIVVSHAESVGLLPPETPTAPVLIDLHNVMSAWHVRRGQHNESKAWTAREQQALDRADAVTTCSAEERRRLIAQHPDVHIPVIVAPLGVDPEEWPDQSWDRSEPIVAMFGSWGWHPNQAGLEWFRTRVWPSVQERMPTARTLVAGSGVTDAADWPTGMEYVGRVDDLAAFTAQATVVAVPVFDGVGAAVKFAESLATGASVIATSDGANAFDDSPALVSDDAQEWADLIVDRLTSRADATPPDGSRTTALRGLTWADSIAPLDTWLSSG